MVGIDGTPEAGTPSGSATPPPPPRESGEEPEPETPNEVTPQRVRKRVAAVTKTKPTRRLQPGDLICGQCGEGNAPTRKFCSRCGEELGSAEVVKSPWYRKLMFWRRRPKQLAAGTRPGEPGTKKDLGTRARGGYRKLRALLAVAALGIGMVYLFVPPVRGLINDTVANPTITVRRWWSQNVDVTYVPVTPASNGATRALAQHPGAFGTDRDKQTFWAANWRRGLKRPALTVTFRGAQDISYIVVSSGAVGKAFKHYYRPATLHVQYPEHKSSENVKLVDESDDQVIKLKKAKDVTRIEIYVASVYPESKAKAVAITDVEFKTKESQE